MSGLRAVNCIKILAAASLVLAISGCAQQAPQAYFAPFAPEQYLNLPTLGTGTVTGQVFLRTRGGDVKVGAGNTVYLLQETEYSKQFYLAYAQSQRYPGIDPRALSAAIQTQANATGEFTFNNVPPGFYYVISQVTWGAPTRYGLSTQGGDVMAHVEVANDLVTTIMVTR